MLSIRRLGLVLAALAVSSTSADAATILAHDDGEFDNAWGFGGATTAIFFVSYATPSPGSTQVTAMQTMFGHASASVLNGSPLTVGVWSDPNGDGFSGDAVLLASAPGTISGAGTFTFSSYPFASPVTISSPRFFIGYSLSVPASVFVGSYDFDTPLPNTSWIKFPASNMTDLSSPFNVNASQPGVLMIRAEVAAVPEPAAAACHLVLGAGAVGLIGRRQRRRR